MIEGCVGGLQLKHRIYNLSHTVRTKQAYSDVTSEVLYQIWT